MLNYENVLEKLLDYVPKLNNYNDYKYISDNGNRNNQYVVFGVLQNFFKEVFKEKKIKILESISKFLEEACSSDDLKLKELGMFGFMENLYGNPEDFDKDMLDYFGKNTKQVLIDTVEHNSKIGMEDKEKIYKLFGDKLNK